MDIVYHEMIENFQDDKCIICILKNKALNKFFDDFLYESVNDYEIRDKIKKDGICPRHAKKLEALGDVLAHAIIYSDLLMSFKGNQFTAFLPRKKKIEEKQKCVFCEKEEGFEETYTKAFSQYFSKMPEFKEGFVERGFLCRSHFIEIIEKINSASSQKELVLVMKSKVDQILKHLERIKEKNDYRSIHINYTAEEVRAWHMAVEFIAGH